jgi:purine-nucleoside phosphorylase
MYTTFTAQDYRRNRKLPDDYHVDGMLCYGTWDIQKQVALFKETLESLGVDFTYGELTGFIGKIVEFNIEGKQFWFDVTYGGPMLSEFLNFACLFGSKKNILLGTCGGLSPEINSLELILPTYSWANESTTRMYGRTVKDNKHFSDKALTESLNNRIGTQFKTWSGKTTTCQAMMAETPEDVQEWSKEGYFGVEMEAATLFAVSNHFKVPSAAILMVMDNLIKDETVLSESYENNKMQREAMRKVLYRIAVEELLSE